MVETWARDSLSFLADVALLSADLSPSPPSPSLKDVEGSQSLNQTEKFPQVFPSRDECLLQDGHGRESKRRGAINRECSEVKRGRYETNSPVKFCPDEDFSQSNNTTMSTDYIQSNRSQIPLDLTYFDNQLTGKEHNGYILSIRTIPESCQAGMTALIEATPIDALNFTNVPAPYEGYQKVCHSPIAKRTSLQGNFLNNLILETPKSDVVPITRKSFEFRHHESINSNENFRSENFNKKRPYDLPIQEYIILPSAPDNPNRTVPHHNLSKQESSFHHNQSTVFQTSVVHSTKQTTSSTQTKRCTQQICNSDGEEITENLTGHSSRACILKDLYSCSDCGRGYSTSSNLARHR